MVWMILALLLSIFTIVLYKVNRGQAEELEGQEYIINVLVKRLYDK
ncbi:hypothetical protein [Staphylococcus simulans]|nr:hypothetical protein [Staphylococcus simulans]